jgi:hypothetical protein
MVENPNPIEKQIQKITTYFIITLLPALIRLLAQDDKFFLQVFQEPRSNDLNLHHYHL